MTDRHQLWALLDRVQMDVRALDTKIQSIRTHVAALELPDQPDPIRCPHCAATHRSRTQHEEHLYRIHNGPVPSSDLAAERAAGLDRLETTRGAVTNAMVEHWGAPTRSPGSRARIPRSRRTHDR